MMLKLLSPIRVRQASIVVTALVYRVLNPLAIGNEVQFEPGTRMKAEGDQSTSIYSNSEVKL